MYQQLAQLIRDGVWLKSYLAAVMRLQQEAYLVRPPSPCLYSDPPQSDVQIFSETKILMPAVLSCLVAPATRCSTGKGVLPVQDVKAAFLDAAVRGMTCMRNT